MKKVVAVNASPRKGWNTDILVTEAMNGAEQAGAEVVKYDLYRLEKYTGCISCFACKTEKNFGKCVCKDGLAPVLEDIRTADALILGTPNYLGDVSAGFRALYERLIFQYITYNRDAFNASTRRIPVFLVMTSNAPETMYVDLMNQYKETFERFIGPTTVMRCGETLQVKDYSRFSWTIFDPEQRKMRREEVFPAERKAAFEAGASLV